MNSPSEFADALREHFSLAGSVSMEQCERLWRHFELLARWNKVLNLASSRSMEEAVVRHYCQSLFVALELPREPVSVLDVGSGAGFPGIPMAVFRPDCHFVLAESHGRKAAFLREATRDLPHVRVAAQRAETLGEKFDWVVSRAVAWKQLRKHAGRLGRSVALLLSTSDVQKVRATRGWGWRAPVVLPWSGGGVVLVGSACST
jgi:16S rRNA (guanine527-N7)-methyltransferase